MNVAVTEIGRQVRKPALRIDAFPVPSDHSVHDESVPKAVESWTTAAAVLLYAGAANHIPHKLPGRDNAVAAALMNEHTVFRLRRCSCFAASIQVLAESGSRANGN